MEDKKEHSKNEQYNRAAKEDTGKHKKMWSVSLSYPKSSGIYLEWTEYLKIRE